MPTWLLQSPTGPTSGVALVVFIERITDWVFIGFLMLSVIFIVLAGLEFIMGGGEPTRVAQARTKLFFAVAALAIAVLSRAVVFAIVQLLNV